MATPAQEARQGIAAFGPISTTGKSAGLLAFIGLLMLVIWVAVLDNSPVLPGNWSAYLPDMTFYFGTYGFAMILIALRRDLLADTASTIRSFVFRLGAFTGITWLILSLIFFAEGTSAVTVLTDTERLQTFVFVGFFVAPVEELLFRLVLPRFLNSWIWGSVIIFTLFHIPAYVLETGSWGVPLIASLAEAAILGFILWLVYAPKKDGGILGQGYPATLGIHFAYDVIILGAVSGIPLAVVHLGLVPL